MARAQCHLSDVQPLFSPTIFSLQRCCLDGAGTAQPSFQSLSISAVHPMAPHARWYHFMPSGIQKSELQLVPMPSVGGSSSYRVLLFEVGIGSVSADAAQ